MGRTPCCEKMGLKKGPWSPEEDQILINYISLHGHSNWRALPKQAGLLRCGKSCRLRWINYLRPDIKRGNFTQEEEENIIKLHKMLGNRWSTIAARLSGRTDNEIKNVWHTRLKKRLPKPTQTEPSSTATAHDMDIVMGPMQKQVRKSKRAEKGRYLSTKAGIKHVKCMDPEENNDPNNNNVNVRPTKSAIKNEPVSPRPCSSEISTVTSTSPSCCSSTSDRSEEKHKENVGEKDHFEDYSELNDDFWMNVLSIDDQDLPCISQCDLSSSSGPSTTELIFESDSKVQSDDMDVFWYNLLTRSNDLPELS